MSSSQWLLLAIGMLLCILLGLSYFWVLKPLQEHSGKNIPNDSVTAEEPDNANETEAAQLQTMPASHPLLDKLHHPGTSAAEDLEILHTMIVQLRTSIKGGQRPLGTNEDFTAWLTGGNRLRLAAIPADHPAIDAQRRLTDRWGRPYFFHPLSSDRVELRSAGPDGTLFTEDDVTTQRYTPDEALGTPE